MTQAEFVEKWLEQFDYVPANVVALQRAEMQSDLAAVLAAELERCATIAEETVRDEWIDGIGWQTVTETVAAAIRSGNV